MHYLPDWAKAHDTTGSLVPGRQLCTRDGRKIGNAHITAVETKDYASQGIPPLTLHTLLTDAGTKLRMTACEIDERFYIGEFISDPEEVIKKFGRDYHGE